MGATRHGDTTTEWEAIRATAWEQPGHPRRLVYWNRVVRGADSRGFTERLSVARLGDGWAWTHRGPEVNERGIGVVHVITPGYGTTAAAKRAADAYFDKVLAGD